MIDAQPVACAAQAPDTFWIGQARWECGPDGYWRPAKPAPIDLLIHTPFEDPPASVVEHPQVACDMGRWISQTMHPDIVGNGQVIIQARTIDITCRPGAAPVITRHEPVAHTPKA